MHHRSFLFTGKMLPYYKLVRALAFPSILRILFLLLIFNLIGSAFAFAFARPTWESILYGLFFGFSVLFVPAILTDAVSAYLVLRDDPLFYVRRCLALSLFSCMLWVLILGFGGMLEGGLKLNFFPQQPFYVALFTVLPLRTLAVFSMSSKQAHKKFLFSYMQPLASSVAAVIIFNLNPSLFVRAFSAAALFSLASVSVLLRYIESKGQSAVRTSPLWVFRAFLVDWLNRENDMFERFLEEIGTEEQIRVTVVRFRDKRSNRPKGLLVVSDFHPGPFLNVGSSALPYLIQKRFEADGMVVSVPHGVSGHEHNLVSQAQNMKLISAVEGLLQNSELNETVSNFKRVEVGSAKIGAQLVGDCLLLTLTQSPNDMEDIPFHLGKEVEGLAKTRFKHVAVVDSHNCITDARIFTEQELVDLKEAASQAIESPLSSRAEFEMGAAKSAFEVGGPEEGAGPGGISVLVLKTFGQVIAYVTIDGNNMALHLREKILASLECLGIDGGEIMTTDTHVVNGLVPARLGYHPVGEAMDHNVVIDLVRATVERAKQDLEEATVSASSGSVRVKSLGSKSLESLLSFMYGVAKLVALYMLMLFLGSNLVGLMIIR